MRMLSRLGRARAELIRDTVRAYVAERAEVVSADEDPDITALPHAAMMLKPYLEQMGELAPIGWQAWPQETIQREMGVALRDIGATWDPEAGGGLGAFRGVRCW